MKAVIPCAKKKDSLFPFIDSRPTGLLPVMGKPLVKHLIHSLQEVGVDDIYLVTNYLEERFEEEFEEYTNVNIVHQEEVTGTAAAINCCSFIDEDFFVVNGDVIVSENDLENLYQKHRNTGPGLTLLGTDQDKPEKFGVLSITNDTVTELEEKPEEAENPLINTGIYIFPPEIFDAIQDSGKELMDAVEKLIDTGEARFELVEDYWIDINSPRKLLKADRVKRDYHVGHEVSESADVSDRAEIDGDAIIEENASIKAGAVLEGKVFVGEGATVGPNTVVRDSTVSRNSVVEAAEVDSTLLFERNVLESTCFIEGSVLGEEVDVKPGTVIRESFIGPRSFVEMNNSIRGVKFVPDARTDLSEISK